MENGCFETVDVVFRSLSCDSVNNSENSPSNTKWAMDQTKERKGGGKIDVSKTKGVLDPK